MGQQDHFPKSEDRELKKRLTDPSSCRAAFSKMVALYSEPLYWKIRRMVLTHDNANDVLQNTFLKAWSKLDSFRGEAKLSMADSYFDGDKLQSLLQAAIALLPDAQRTVFCMRYYDEMKYSEISKVLGTSEGALKANYHLAVKKIAAVIKQSEI